MIGSVLGGLNLANSPMTGSPMAGSPLNVTVETTKKSPPIKQNVARFGNRHSVAIRPLEAVEETKVPNINPIRSNGGRLLEARKTLDPQANRAKTCMLPKDFREELRKF